MMMVDKVISSEFFDLETVQRHFEQSIHEDEDLLMDEYLAGYKEFNKFFRLMGSIFSFVSGDVENKIKILEDFRRKDNADKFISFRGMIEYEKHENLLSNSNYVSGCRTLLRLHRGLDFIRDFLGRLAKIAESDKTTTPCQAAYNDTLAKYHPWLVRKGAVVAMYALPTREELLKKVCSNVEKAVNDLPKMLNTTRIVYERTENLYTKFDLHALP